MIDVMRKECFLDMVYREGTTSEKDEYSRYFEPTEIICEEVGDILSGMYYEWNENLGEYLYVEGVVKDKAKKLAKKVKDAAKALTSGGIKMVKSAIAKGKQKCKNIEVVVDGVTLSIIDGIKNKMENFKGICAKILGFAGSHSKEIINVQRLIASIMKFKKGLGSLVLYRGRLIRNKIIGVGEIFNILSSYIGLWTGNEMFIVNDFSNQIDRSSDKLDKSLRMQSCGILSSITSFINSINMWCKDCYHRINKLIAKWLKNRVQKKLEKDNNGASDKLSKDHKKLDVLYNAEKRSEEINEKYKKYKEKKWKKGRHLSKPAQNMENQEIKNRKDMIERAKKRVVKPS